MFRMRDEKGGDDKILCVPAGDPRQEHLRDLHHLPEFDRLEIEHFFLIYKQLEPGKSIEGTSWADHAAAEVEASRRRLRDTPGPESGRRGSETAARFGKNEPQMNRTDCGAASA
jgi:inorganic pyrophosphatase